MKIQIISDSHGNTADFYSAVLCEKPDYLFFLGDVEKDFYYIRDMFPEQRVFAVAGNNDWCSSLNIQDTVILNGKKIFYCHGHTQSVRSGTERIKNTLLTSGCDIALFGHTHEPIIEWAGEQRLIMNPGAMYTGRYGIITVNGGEIIPELKRI